MVSMTLAFAEGGGNIINPDGSLIVVLVLFVIFVFALNRLLFRPVGRVLDERETLIEGATNEGRAARRMYDARLAEYEASIRHARAEGYHLAEQERAAALDARRRVIDDAKAQAHEQIEVAKQEIEQQVVQARATLESESRQIAERISRTVLGRSVGGGS